MTNMKILQNKELKIVQSKNYNSYFNKETGFFARWGKTKEDDPIYAPMPEILDLEISSGKCMGQCPECYKCNGTVDKLENMSFETFQNIFHKVAKTEVKITYKNGEVYVMPWYGVSYLYSIPEIVHNLKLTTGRHDIKTIEIYNTGLLQQIAFGICDISSNPDFFKMMKYCRAFGVVPNYTCHGLDMTEKYAKLSAEYCGAVAISVYQKEKSYEAVRMLHRAGLKQINFHVIAHDKSYNKILSILDDLTTNLRIKGKVKAVVLLKYKPKGNGIGKFKHLTVEQYRNIINKAEELGIGIGFDSCSAHSYLNIIKNDKDYEQKAMCAEPCESSCFSSYINVKGEFFACSFCEGEGMWKEGINVLNVKDFDEIWYNEKTEKFRKMLLKNKRKCPMFPLD